MNGGMLNLKTEGGNIIFDDEISSVDREYNLSVRGNGEVFFNNNVRGVSNFVFDNSFLTLGPQEPLCKKLYRRRNAGVNGNRQSRYFGRVANLCGK